MSLSWFLLPEWIWARPNSKFFSFEITSAIITLTPFVGFPVLYRHHHHELSLVMQITSHRLLASLTFLPADYLSQPSTLIALVCLYKGYMMAITRRSVSWLPIGCGDEEYLHLPNRISSWFITCENNVWSLFHLSLQYIDDQLFIKVKNIIQDYLIGLGRMKL
jgi:hypothetical protein